MGHLGWLTPALLTQPSMSTGGTKLQLAFNKDFTEDRGAMPNFLTKKGATLDKLLCSEHFEIGVVDFMYFIVTI